MDQYKTVDVTGLGDMMIEAQFAQTDDPPIGTKWAVCSQCLMSFHQNEMTQVRGKWYCKANGCYRDTLPKKQEK